VVISTRARNDAVPETLRLRIAEKLTLFIQGEFTDGDAGTDAGADPDADAGPSIGQPPASDA
jgi:hypothetical protein